MATTVGSDSLMGINADNALTHFLHYCNENLIDDI